MKKRIITVALVIALLATCFAGSYAYLMDTEADKNVMEVGNVDIVQNEYERNTEGALVEFTGDETLLPMGDDPAVADVTVTKGEYTFNLFSDVNALDKIVTVTNNGNTNAYVRTIVALEAGATAEEAATLYNYIALTSGIDGKGAVVNNGMSVKIGDKYYIIVSYTYNTALTPDEESAPSLTGVALTAAATNEIVQKFGGEYEVLVLSQAVQASGMGVDAAAALNKAFGEINAANIATWFADVA